MLLEQKKSSNVVLGDVKTSEYKILANEKMFSILSSKLYSDKLMAPIRELLCNAYDAHIAANRMDKAILVTQPTVAHPEFRVRDYGTGLSESGMQELYTTYGASTKNLSNDFIGCMGLGSKSPFAYTDSFVVTSRHNGMCHHFVCSLVNGRPQIDRFPSKRMEKGELSGLEVSFNVNKGDIYAFSTKLESFCEWFHGDVDITTDGNDVHRVDKCELNFEDSVATTSRLAQAMYVRMGGVMYPCNLPDFTTRNFPLTREQYDRVIRARSNLGHLSFVLDAKVGDVDIAASREHCELTGRTINWVLSTLFNYLDNVEQNFLKELDAKNLGDLEYCTEYSKFLDGKPFLSRKALNDKVAKCFNLCVYSAAEVADLDRDLKDIKHEWTVCWTASDGSRRYRQLLRTLPPMLSHHQPRSSRLRYNNSPLANVRAVIEGSDVKFYQLAETVKSPSVPQKVSDFLAKSGDPDIILIRDDKQAEHLRKLGIKVWSAEDLPKIEKVKSARTVQSTTPGSSSPKPRRTAVQSALAKLRWAISTPIRHLDFTPTLTGTAAVTDRDEYMTAALEAVDKDKLIILPITKKPKSTDYQIAINWLTTVLAGELGWTVLAGELGWTKLHDVADCNQHLVNFLRSQGYIVLTKTIASVAVESAEIVSQLSEVCGKLKISPPQKLIADAIKNYSITPAVIEREVLSRIFAHLVDGVDPRIIETVESVLPTTLKKRLKLTEIQEPSISASKLMIALLHRSHKGSSISMEACSHAVVSVLDDMYVPSLPAVPAFLDAYKAAEDIWDKAFPLIRKLCTWEQRWLKCAVHSVMYKGEGVLQYFEAMAMYHKNKKTVFVSDAK